MIKGHSQILNIYLDLWNDVEQLETLQSRKIPQEKYFIPKLAQFFIH